MTTINKTMNGRYTIFTKDTEGTVKCVAVKGYTAFIKTLNKIMAKTDKTISEVRYGKDSHLVDFWEFVA